MALDFQTQTAGTGQDEPGIGASLMQSMRNNPLLTGALAAATIPAIVMARGSAGKEIGNLLKKFAPAHFERANKSPFPYLIDTEMAKGGPTFGLVSGTKEGSRIQDLMRIMQGGNDPGPGRELVTKHLGRTPDYFGYLNVPTDRVDPLAAAMHEFGHLSGFERARAAYPQASVTNTFKLGSNHLDLLGEPKTQDILKSALQRPENRQYFAGRLATDSGHQPTYDSLGELLTDVWAQRMIERGGGQHKSVTTSPLWQGTKRRLATQGQESPLVDYVAQHGRLYPAHHKEQMDALVRLLQAMGGQ